MTFRAVRADDLPALKAVIETTTLFPSEMLDGMLAAYIAGTSGDDLWLTTAEPLPLAVAYCVREPLTAGTCNLLLIAVHASQRRRGLGRALLDHVEATLAARGDRLLLVDTSSDAAFDGTREFYRRAGYEEEARIRDYYQDGDAKVTFRKRLR
ncbi:N-acetyltransferase [Luteitalea sp. TBR-22]|uniref:GNAT family N-acetyltransferase n=1 Tax=Luteitalea sp. TBR-22 TaxID=2802971 RepID=UPI001EF5D08C|nr:N-acetyltransferase [Luteitalea sp. TBR-22]